MPNRIKAERELHKEIMTIKYRRSKAGMIALVRLSLYKHKYH